MTNNIPRPNSSPSEFPQLHNLTYYYDELQKAIDRLNTIRPYSKKSLGKIKEYDIFLITPSNLDPCKPNILNAAGFHGDEPAGPWGILEYQKIADPALLCSVNHSFLNLVNPTGFASATRFNAFNENPNAGFIAIPPEIRNNGTWTNKSWPSIEGDILLTYQDYLFELAEAGFITQHEDWRMNDAFLFIYENAKMPSLFALTLLDTLEGYFNIASNDNPFLSNIILNDGICHNDIDGSYESLLKFYGVPFVATTETPGQCKIKDRINANRDIVKSFVEFIIK